MLIELVFVDIIDVGFHLGQVIQNDRVPSRFGKVNVRRGLRRVVYKVVIIVSVKLDERVIRYLVVRQSVFGV